MPDQDDYVTWEGEECRSEQIIFCVRSSRETCKQKKKERSLMKERNRVDVQLNGLLGRASESLA